MKWHDQFLEQVVSEKKIETDKRMDGIFSPPKFGYPLSKMLSADFFLDFDPGNKMNVYNS